MINIAIEHCQKFLTALKSTEGISHMAVDEFDVKHHKVACVRADYLQMVVDTARKAAELEVRLEDLRWMLEAERNR